MQLLSLLILSVSVLHANAFQLIGWNIPWGPKDKLDDLTVEQLVDLLYPLGLSQKLGEEIQCVSEICGEACGVFMDPLGADFEKAYFRYEDKNESREATSACISKCIESNYPRYPYSQLVEGEFVEQVMEDSGSFVFLMSARSKAKAIEHALEWEADLKETFSNESQPLDVSSDSDSLNFDSSDSNFDSEEMFFDPNMNPEEITYGFIDDLARKFLATESKDTLIEMARSRGISLY